MTDVFSGVNIVFTIFGAMFYLYSKSVEKQFKSVEEEIALLRADSKADDQEVKSEIKEEINRRVGQTSDLHGRVGNTESSLCKAENRIAVLEGLHQEHK